MKIDLRLSFNLQQGKEQQQRPLLKQLTSILSKEKLAKEKKPILAGTESPYLKVFEWQSYQAIEVAHLKPYVKRGLFFRKKLL